MSSRCPSAVCAQEGTSECLPSFFPYSAACSSHGIDGYQTLIDQTRPAFTTPVESVSRKEVPGQAVFAQQASWTNQILSEHPKGKVDFLFLESSTSAFILWNLFSSCVPTRKKNWRAEHPQPGIEWIAWHRTLDISWSSEHARMRFEASCKLSWTLKDREQTPVLRPEWSQLWLWNLHAWSLILNSIKSSERSEEGKLCHGY